MYKCKIVRVNCGSKQEQLLYQEFGIDDNWILRYIFILVDV